MNASSSKQQRSRATRERILRSAEECIALRGYDATSVAEICTQAEISKGAFYHHFASKQAVFLELLTSWLGNLSAQMAAIRRSSSSVPEALADMAAVVREVFRAGGHQLHIFLEFLTKAVRDPTIWQSTIQPYRQYRAYFTRIVEEGIQEGSLRPVDAEQVAQVLVSLGVGIVFQGILDPHGANWESVTQKAVQLIVDSLRLEKKT